MRLQHPRPHVEAAHHQTKRVETATTNPPISGNMRSLWHAYVPIWAAGLAKATVVRSSVSLSLSSFLRLGEGEDLAT